MTFQIIPTAEASIVTLMASVNKVIINPLIYFLFALAVIYFLYGLVKYLLSPDNEELRTSSKSHMLWGIFGMFIMVAVFGIMNLLLTTIGVDKNQINIDSSGYKVGELK